MTDVTTELAKLTASTTELTNTVVGKYAALDAKVTAAGDSADEASASAVDAAQSVVDAQTVVDAASSELAAITAADRLATAASVTAAGAHVTSAQKEKAGAEAARVGAETAEANAAAIVTGGTATTLSEAGKIPLANSEGKIDNAWIAGAAKCTKQDFEARRAANNEKFAASGFVHFGKHRTDGSNYVPINEGLYTHLGITNTLQTGSSSYQTGESKTDFPMINIAGVLSVIYSLGDANYSRIKLPPAEDGTRTYDGAIGLSVTHATSAIAFASETETNKVVTDRVDMWGFEAFLREINDADPFVYENGLIQSLATNINGVSTVTDNVRPDTYFAWYEGDEDSRGRGVNWQTASEANRIKIASDPANNIYFDDATGKFYQWCIRGRSFAGAGNGDWYNVSPVNGYLYYGGSSSAVISQGIDNADVGIAPRESVDYRYYNNIENDQGATPQIGSFVSYRSSAAVNGECYFLVCGTVNRLNKGAYHPIFNSSGAAVAVNGNDNASPWYSESVSYLNSAAACFEKWQNKVRPGSVGGYIGYPHQRSGGRPDGRFYDAIYASGQGGVCRDMRYSAWGLTPEDFAEADLKVKQGTYRGWESPLYNRVIPESRDITGVENTKFTSSGSSLSSGGYIVINDTKKDSRYAYIFSNGDIYLRKEGVNPYLSIKYNDDLLVLTTSSGWEVGDILYLIEVSQPLEASVGGVSTFLEVVGVPQDILACDVLSPGWWGCWNPFLQYGSVTIPLTRKFTSSGEVVFTDDGGESWARYGASIDILTNTWTHSNLHGRVSILTYKSHAKITTPRSNKEVYGGAKGVGSVGFYCYGGSQWASNLAYSTMGKVLNASSSSSFIGSTAVLSEFNIRPVQKYLDVHLGREPAYVFDANSQTGFTGDLGFKALNYNVVENQQGFINYAYTELRHNGTDWGDDGKIHIADNQATRLDDNGNSVVYGTARIVEPLGWIKNDK